MRKTMLAICLLLPMILLAQEQPGAMDVIKMQKELIGTQAPALRFTNWVLNVPADTNLSGKVRVVEFWATWCVPCLAAVPHLNKLKDKMKGENIVFLSVGYESPEKMQTVFDKVAFETVVVSDQTKTTHRDLRVEYKGLMPIPRTVVIDEANHVVWVGTPKKLSEKMLRGFMKKK